MNALIVGNWKMERRGNPKYHWLLMKVGETKIIENKKPSQIYPLIYARREYHNRMDMKFKCKSSGNNTIVTRIE